jgi:hypothetical protein
MPPDFLRVTLPIPNVTTGAAGQRANADNSSLTCISVP